MKKFLSMMLAILLVIGLFAGCSDEETATPNTDDNAGNVTPTENTDYANMTIDELKPLIETINAGKLTMVTSPDFAPYEFYALDEEGNPNLAGFDIALANYIADYIGLELEIVTMDFNGTITELGMGNADIGMAGYSPDPEREDAMDFSIVYYEGGQSFVTNKENADKFTTLADANNAEYQIGAQTFTEKEWEKFLDKFDSVQEAIRELMKEEQARKETEETKKEDVFTNDASTLLTTESTSCVYKTADPDDDIRYITWYTEEGIFCRKAGQTEGYEWAITFENKEQYDKVMEFIGQFPSDWNMRFADHKNFWNDFLNDKWTGINRLMR